LDANKQATRPYSYDIQKRGTTTITIQASMLPVTKNKIQFTAGFLNKTWYFNTTYSTVSESYL